MDVQILSVVWLNSEQDEDAISTKDLRLFKTLQWLGSLSEDEDGPGDNHRMGGSDDDDNDDGVDDDDDDYDDDDIDDFHENDRRWVWNKMSPSKNPSCWMSSFLQMDAYRSISPVLRMAFDTWPKPSGNGQRINVLSANLCVAKWIGGEIWNGKKPRFQFSKPSSSSSRFDLSLPGFKWGFPATELLSAPNLFQHLFPLSPERGGFIRWPVTNNSIWIRLADWVAFLHTAVMEAVVMCRDRNPACTATGALGKERYINGFKKCTSMHMALYKWSAFCITVGSLCTSKFTFSRRGIHQTETHRAICSSYQRTMEKD